VGALEAVEHPAPSSLVAHREVVETVALARGVNGGRRMRRMDGERRGRASTGFRRGMVRNRMQPRHRCAVVTVWRE
jgi:hypothetical protein